MTMKQICPAIGWTALYEDEAEVVSVPLACWGLNNGEVVGMVPHNGGCALIRADTRVNFKGYDYDTEGSMVDFALMNNDE